MLRQERFEDPQEALRSAMLGWQAELWTALPGILESFDPSKMTAVVQPTIKGIFRLKNGSSWPVTMPLCLDVPVQFIGGGGFTHTFPMEQEDEGLLVFSSRCIDAWWQSGGVQGQPEIRMHDLSDGFFIPGFRSVPRVLSDISTTTTQLRSDDGTMFVEIGASQIRLKHPMKVMVESPLAEFSTDVKIDGNLNVTGDTSLVKLTTTGDASLGGGLQAVKLADNSSATKVKAT